MNVLGISCYYHDAAAALVKDGLVVAAAQEERFSRIKNDPSFPRQAVRYCLEHQGISLEGIDAVVFYDKPFLKFERLLETYYAFAPRGVRSFIAAMPVWIKQKLLLKTLLREELSPFASSGRADVELLFSEHHLSHAAAAFYPSPFESAAILTLDGVGEWATASICHGRGAEITILREQHFPHSIGLLYSAFTQFLGFRVNSGEYKLMGLAPYGDPASPRTARYEAAIRESLADLKDDGSLWLNQEYFDYAVGNTMVNATRWEELFGIPCRTPESELLPEHCDMALAIQRVTEDLLLRMAGEAKRLTGERAVCLAGGVALNCVANGRLLRSGIFGDIWIQPAAGDAGGALGAALAGYHIFAGKSRVPVSSGDGMNGSYLGPEFSDLDIARTARKYGAVWERFDDFEALCEKTATLLAEGNVIGWFQGRMEWGPRALGNRSIIADPRIADMQSRLNLKIKFREGFRPFAPSVAVEDAGDYFDMDAPSPYMLLVADLLDRHRCPLPEGYHLLGVREKFRHLRSDLPAVTHVDFSARLQTVHHETNPRYLQLIKAFKRKTGCGVIVNTSFNVRGEPIVLTPDDAYACFMATDMDCLVMGEYLFMKSRQPELRESMRRDCSLPGD